DAREEALIELKLSSYAGVLLMLITRMFTPHPHAGDKWCIMIMKISTDHIVDISANETSPDAIEHSPMPMTTI
nr:hypothetical protein [Tanacetum cinerariifolium]